VPRSAMTLPTAARVDSSASGHKWPEVSSVVLASAWRIRACTVLMSAPDATSTEAKWCRRSWKLNPSGGSSIWSLSSSSASNATAPDANLRLVLDLPTVVRFFRAYGLSCRHSG